jgi:hypothetical protein
MQLGNSVQFGIDAAGQLNSMLERLEFFRQASLLIQTATAVCERKVPNAFLSRSK